MLILVVEAWQIPKSTSPQGCVHPSLWYSHPIQHPAGPCHLLVLTDGVFCRAAWIFEFLSSFEVKQLCPTDWPWHLTSPSCRNYIFLVDYQLLSYSWPPTELQARAWRTWLQFSIHGGWGQKCVVPFMAKEAWRLMMTEQWINILLEYLSYA